MPLDSIRSLPLLALPVRACTHDYQVRERSGLEREMSDCVLALRLLTTIQVWMVEATFRPPKFGAVGGKALFHRRWFSYLDFGCVYQ